jgi:hypothetical protein
VFQYLADDARGTRDNMGHTISVKHDLPGKPYVRRQPSRRSCGQLDAERIALIIGELNRGLFNVRLVLVVSLMVLAVIVSVISLVVTVPVMVLVAVVYVMAFVVVRLPVLW